MSPNQRKRRGFMFRYFNASMNFLRNQFALSGGNPHNTGKSKRSVIKNILWLLLLPFQLIAGLIKVIWVAFQNWWHQTDSRALVRGLPALILFVLTGYAIASAMVRSENKFANSYIQAADKAFQNEDFQTARLLYDRLVANGENSPEILYRLAVSAEKLGDRQRAQTIIISLSPEDQPGYSPAQVSRARQYLTSPDLIARLRLQRARRHLQQALAANPKNVLAHELLARINFYERRWPEAVEHLNAIVDSRPDLLMQLAIVHAANQDRDTARVYAERAQGYFTKQVEAEPGNIEARLKLAEALTYLMDFDRAIRFLQDGLLHEDSRKLKAAISRVYVTYADNSPKETLEDRQKQFELLSNAFRMETRDLRLFDRLMEILTGKDELADEARKFLEQNVVDGRGTALAHLLLGTVAGTDGNFEDSVFHLEQAYKLDPNMAIVGNNLAWYLAEKPDAELDRALELITTVLKLSGGTNAYFYDTRGYIMQKQGKYESALVDYERALTAMKNDPGLHERLAKLYEQLNKPDLATRHEEKAQELWKQYNEENDLLPPSGKN